jgi:hypothetical protein
MTPHPVHVDATRRPLVKDRFASPETVPVLREKTGEDWAGRARLDSRSHRYVNGHRKISKVAQV